MQRPSKIAALLVLVFSVLVLLGELFQNRIPAWSLVLVIGALLLIGRQVFTGARLRHPH